jgi:hypothetical protein
MRLGLTATTQQTLYPKLYSHSEPANRIARVVQWPGFPESEPET